MSVTVSGVKHLWTPNALATRRYEDTERGFTAIQDPFTDVRTLPYTSFQEGQAYHNTSFELSQDFIRRQDCRGVTMIDL